MYVKTFKQLCDVTTGVFWNIFLLLRYIFISHINAQIVFGIKNKYVNGTHGAFNTFTRLFFKQKVCMFSFISFSSPDGRSLTKISGLHAWLYYSLHAQICKKITQRQKKTCSRILTLKMKGGYKQIDIPAIRFTYNMSVSVCKSLILYLNFYCEKIFLCPIFQYVASQHVMYVDSTLQNKLWVWRMIPNCTLNKYYLMYL